MIVRYDAVVVGAGPYGLSVAAHLLAQGKNVAVFGKPLGLWREHMPRGMLLRSHWWATHLSDPAQRWPFDRFMKQAGYKKGYPLPAEAFIGYGLWFQERAVPQVDETFVASIEHSRHGFTLRLQDGRLLESSVVVMAIGMQAYAQKPIQFLGWPKSLVSHSIDHGDFGPFKDKQVVVVGGGQSAIEYAALLAEAGAQVRVVARRPIVWLKPDRMDERSWREKIMAPKAGIAAGWSYWAMDHFPYLFYQFPKEWKDAYNARYHSGACDWLRHRLLGRVILHESEIITKITRANDHLDLVLTDGTRFEADHVLLATGFKVDLSRLAMLHASLREMIASEDGIPELTSEFESSVPGLYFIGATSVRAFGPLYRFVAGAGAAARRVSRSVARQWPRRTLTVVDDVIKRAGMPMSATTSLPT